MTVAKSDAGSAQFVCAVLMNYAEGGWQSRLLCGPRIAEVEAWLARIQSRPRIAERASGKPLAWLYFIANEPKGSQPLKAARSIGLLPDVLRTFEHPFTNQEFEALQAVFTKHGRPFGGRVEPP